MRQCACPCLLLLPALLFFSFGNCQPANDSAFYSAAVNSIKQAYFSTVKEKAGIYNGIAYEPYGHQASGTPFFIGDTIITGSVQYDGFLYDSVPLKYDMVLDEVLMASWRDNNSLLQLIKNKVSSFYIAGHQFVRVDKEDQAPEGLSGFCELLYRSKKIWVLAKRSRQMVSAAGAEDKSSKFIEQNDYYLYKDGKYSVIRGKDDLVKILADKGAQVKKFMRKLRFKRDKGQAITSTVIFYNGLTE